MNVSRYGIVTGLALAVLVASAAQPARAQTYTVLHAFDAPPFDSHGNLIQTPDGRFHGTMRAGGAGDQGVVFTIDPAGTPPTLTRLHEFAGTDGQFPVTGLAAGSGGYLYGTTSGGAGSRGTVFRILADGSGFQTLHSFTGGSDGAFPRGILVDDGAGGFYGTAVSGGTSNLGTVFRISSTGTFATVISFTGAAGAYPGKNPRDLVRDAGGRLWGVAGGGAPDMGIVFKLDPSTTPPVLTTIHEFAGGAADGESPQGGLIFGSDGNLYGTTFYGGTSGWGTVFKIDPLAPATPPTLLHSFDRTNGASPGATLVEGRDHYLYGSTVDGGTAFRGTLFRVKLDGTGFKLLHSHTGSGGIGYAGLVQGPNPDDHLYGVASQGGTAERGATFFRIVPDGSTFETLWSFSGVDGQNPLAGLAWVGADLWGTTENGGATNRGSVFRIAAAGTQTIHSFAGTDGANPRHALLLARDGNLFGTAPTGGSGAGIVFRIDPAAAPPTFTKVYGFQEDLAHIPADGAQPRGELVQGAAPDTRLYGMTTAGGLGAGIIYAIQPGGTGYQILHRFDSSGSDGLAPNGALVAGPGGKLYGTLAGGAGNGLGTIFTVDPVSGNFARIWDFTGLDDGASPQAGLVPDGTGKFLGTTSAGGANGAGTVFRLDPSAVPPTVTTLYAFSGADGSRPFAAVLHGLDGSFYGTTLFGGPSGFGTIFRLTPGATPPWSLTTIHSFSGADGKSPYAGLVQDVLGNLYGTTYFGGPAGGGVAFKLSLSGGSAVATVSGGGAICSGGSATIQATLSGTPPFSLTWSDGVTQSGVASSPATRSVSPGATTTYTLTAFSDAAGPGTSGGSATVTVQTVATPSIVALDIVGENSSNRTASVANHVGSTYVWTITNGTITAGQGTNSIVFRSGSPGTLVLGVVETNGVCSSPQAVKIVVVAPPGQALLFYPVIPCRLLQTGSPVPPPPLGGADLAPGEIRTIAVPAGGACGIPATAKAIAANAAVLSPGAAGYLQLWPAGTAQPLSSNLNFGAGRTRSNNAIITTPSGASSGFVLFNGSAGTAGLIIDVSGYFE